MQAQEELSSLIGEIYDAALDPSLWIGVLARTAAFCKGQAGGLLTKNSVSHLGDVAYYVGVDDRYVQLYRDIYWRFDPLAPLLLYPAGVVTSVVDYMAEDEFRAGRFFREWSSPQGWADAANVVVENSATTVAILSVLRTAEVDAEMRARMGLLVPHFRRAVVIGDLIGDKSDAPDLAEAVEALATAVFLVAANGRVLHANAAGEALLASGDVLSRRAGLLVASASRTTASLMEAFAAAGSGDTALGSAGVAVPLPAIQGRDLVAHLLPLVDGERRRAPKSRQAAAAVFVAEKGGEAPSVQKALIEAYALTAMEFRVLGAIADAGGVPAAAAVLGVAPNTVKTHLGRIYAKTGTARQADLVKLVREFERP